MLCVQYNPLPHPISSLESPTHSAINYRCCTTCWIASGLKDKGSQVLLGEEKETVQTGVT